VVPHNNQLQVQYGARGLQVIGVTGESLKDTLPWVEKHGVKHGFAFDPKGALSSSLRVTGIPHAVLVDPLGQIVWRGHPNGLKDEQIEAALDAALPQPLWAWPAQLDALKSALLEERFASAQQLAADLKLEGYTGKLPKLIDGRIEARIAGLELLVAEFDVRAAESRLPSLQRGLEGHPGAARLTALAQRLAEDSELAAAREAQTALTKLAAEMAARTESEAAITAADLDAWTEQLKPISQRFSMAAPGREAKALGRTLKELRKALKSSTAQ
jgi:AhpC/TSA family